MQWHVLSVLPERSWLHERIHKRLDIMWQEGLVDEVIGLLERYPLTPNMPAMRCVGYRQVLEYLVHIDHPVFERTHLDKSLFYEAFANSTDDKVKVSNNSAKPMQSQQQHLACEAMRNKALYATRQLAKRQYTWLRKLSKGLAVANQSAIAPAQIDTSITDTQHNIVISSFTSIEQVRDYLE